MEIKCLFNNTLWTSGIYYTCVVSEVDCPSNDFVLKSYNGKLTGKKTNADVTGIYFDNIRLPVFPKGLGKMFPNLKCLSMVNCKLKKIHRSDFAGLGQLMNIDLSENNFKSLPDDLFMDLPHLKRLAFSVTKLRRVSSKLLTHLEQPPLVRLNFNSMDQKSVWTYKEGEFHKLTTIIDETYLPSPDSQQGRLEAMFQSGKGSDLTVKVGEKSIRAHKSILIAQSAGFEKAIVADMEGSQSNILNITDLSLKVVKDLLLFCYAGKLIGKLEHFLEVYKAAATYDMPALLIFCEQYLKRNLKKFDAEKVRDMTESGCFQPERMKNAWVRSIGETEKRFKQIEKKSEKATAETQNSSKARDESPRLNWTEIV